MSSNQPIGILDSGFGGLSVARAVREALPGEDILFAADCAYAPYGDRSSGYILERLDALTGWLIKHRAKALVFACNTATAVGVRRFREKLSMPIIGIEPAVFPAVRETSSAVVGVLATSRTLESAKYRAVKARAAAWARGARSLEVQIIDQPCPGLMEYVEAGDFSSSRLHELLRTYVDPLSSAGADRIVLGCTHYPFLAAAIKKHAPGAVLIDPAPAVAQQLAHKLGESGLLNEAQSGRIDFFASGATPDRFKVLSALWPEAETLNELDA